MIRASDGRRKPGDGDPSVRRPLVFTIVALALLMMSVDSTIVATALHALQHGLGTRGAW
ncbi:MAG TPA: hypothetical protein VGL52_04710 [Casimicrobiaceae bacterium]|jgi:hypothetical protein